MKRIMTILCASSSAWLACRTIFCGHFMALLGGAEELRLREDREFLLRLVELLRQRLAVPDDEFASIVAGVPGAKRGTCDSAKYPSSQDCAYACPDGVCCAAPVPWCTQRAIGTGKCSDCVGGQPLRNELCGTLIGEDVFNFTAPLAPQAVMGSILPAFSTPRAFVRRLLSTRAVRPDSQVLVQLRGWVKS
jgi:hypothetical protein